MAQDYSQVNFRIPTKLKEKIEEASLVNNRSITAELVSRLEQSFEEAKPDIEFAEKMVESSIAKVLYGLINGLKNQGVEWEKVQAAIRSINENNNQ